MIKIASIKYNKDDEYIDDKKFLKNIMTDFINQYYLKSNKYQIRLITLIYKEVNKVINKYGLKLIFKGGNVMNLINNNFMGYLNVNTQKYINSFINEFLSKSDNDFTIFVNPNISHYDLFMDTLSIELFNALDNIRKIIIENIDYYFFFYDLKLSKRIELLHQLKEAINNSAEQNIIRSIVPWKKFDEIYLFNNDETEINVYTPDPNYKNYIYNNLNKTLKFEDSNNNLIHFNLLRSKLNYRFNEDFNVSGELIDISLPLKDDFIMNVLNNDEKFNKYIEKYVYEIVDTSNDIIYYVVNIEYIIKDLYKILYVNSKYPWENSKYYKRLSRILYFIFLGLVDDNPINIESLKYIRSIFINFVKSLKAESEYKINDTYLDQIYYKSINILKLNDEYLNSLIKISNFIINICKMIIKNLEGKTEIDNSEIYKINIK